MTVATSTAGDEGGGGACFLAQERQTSPARKNPESLIVKKWTFRRAGTRGAGMSASDVLDRKLSPGRVSGSGRLYSPNRRRAKATSWGAVILSAVSTPTMALP